MNLKLDNDLADRSTFKIDVYIKSDSNTTSQPQFKIRGNARMCKVNFTGGYVNSVNSALGTAPALNGNYWYCKAAAESASPYTSLEKRVHLSGYFSFEKDAVKASDYLQILSGLASVTGTVQIRVEAVEYLNPTVEHNLFPVATTA
jgi:hypothetical protein